MQNMTAEELYENLQSLSFLEGHESKEKEFIIPTLKKLENFNKLDIDFFTYLLITNESFLNNEENLNFKSFEICIALRLIISDKFEKNGFISKALDFLTIENKSIYSKITETNIKLLGSEYFLKRSILEAKNLKFNKSLENLNLLENFQNFDRPAHFQIWKFVVNILNGNFNSFSKEIEENYSYFSLYKILCFSKTITQFKSEFKELMNENKNIFLNDGTYFCLMKVKEVFMKNYLLKKVQSYMRFKIEYENNSDEYLLLKSIENDGAIKIEGDVVTIK